MSIQRISSGIKGLDEKIGGGFPKNSIILITGNPGTGKTIFCINFLLEGLKNNESCILVLTEQRSEDLRLDILESMNINLEEFEQKRLLKILELEPELSFSPKVFESEKEIGKIIKFYIFNLVEKIEKAVREINAKRLVIDSISILESFIKDEYLRRTALTFFIKRLKNLGVVTLITSSPSERFKRLTISGILEFLVDGIIKLEYNPKSKEFKRTLTILKMRRSKHVEFVLPFHITNEGIKLIETSF
ncbi:MAG: ATPase domain-containing protein [Candidatus Aenigmatarchaeota archaeon]